MNPPRVYRIPEGMFTIGWDYPQGFSSAPWPSLSLRCGACKDSVISAGTTDMTALTEVCRQHEIAAHSSCVTEERFGAGYYYTELTPGWWEEDPLSAFKRNHRDYEWLDGKEVATLVTVRKPDLILAWETRLGTQMAPLPS